MMYSRYTPNQNGGYERRRVPNRPQRPAMPPPPPEPPHPPHDEQHPPHGTQHPSHGTQHLPHEPPHLPYMPPSPQRPPKPQPQGGLLGGLSGLLHGKLQKGDLLMLAILYLILSEDEEDSSLPLIAIALYLILK